MYKILKSIVLLVLIFSVLFYIFYKNSIETPVSKIDKEVLFSINRGEGVVTISQNLFENSLIKSELFFKLYLWKNEFDKKLQAGNYILNTNMSMEEVVSSFLAGNVIPNEIDVKIIEGWNLKDIASSLEKNEVVDLSDFLKLTEVPVSKWNFNFDKPGFLKNLKNENLEGYLFPDTYRIFNNATSQDIIKKSLDNFDKKLTQEMRAEIERQGKSIHEIIIMASIIEKEVIKNDDKRLVSGILNKRMKVGMRLQVDSTINYITGKNDPGASLADLKIDSPYNTYKNFGLPPGPICSPGLSSIMASIYPIESDYLFYLNRQDTFETIFSKNYEEHLLNKNKYLR